MSEPIAEFADYSGMLAGIRKRIGELGIPTEELDRISGLPKGYFSKLTARQPMRRIGMKSLGDLMGALAMRAVFVADADALDRIRRNPNYRLRDDKLIRTAASEFSLSHRFLRKIASKGGRATQSKLTSEQRSRLARKLNKIRWHKPKIVELKGAKREKAMVAPKGRRGNGSAPCSVAGGSPEALSRMASANPRRGV